jgi:EF-P beta-lysylation protein EpmB
LSHPRGLNINTPHHTDLFAEHFCQGLGILFSFLELDPARAPFKLADSGGFPFLVPWSYAKRMQKGSWSDPLLLQVLPRAEEMVEREGFSRDPVGDSAAETVPGLLCKYASRALLLASDRCAVHCRFCFRRSGCAAGPGDWDRVWRYINDHADIREVILSGGDPLCLDAAELAMHLERASSTDHLDTVRIHTRVPVVAPELVDAEMAGRIADLARVKPVVLVVHVNHAAELGVESSGALARLRSAGAFLLNQSVLLRGINDRADTLEALSRSLIAQGVMPYYLHQLDRAAGAWHFEVEEELGRALVRELGMRLPGYLVPRYVREIAGERAKRPL